MAGFFTKKEVESKSRPKGKSYSCVTCKLMHECSTPKMEVVGSFKKKILIITDFPSELDDQRGQLLIGREGRIISKALAEFDIDLFEDCAIIAAVNCFPNEVEPSKFQVDCCRKEVVGKVISSLNPKLIIPLGDLAIYSIIGNRWKKDFDNIYKWRGWNIPDQDLKCWVCPTFHMNQVDHIPDMELIFKKDLEQALQCLEKSFPVFKEPKIHYLKSIDDLYETISCYQEIVIDYETTGIKPYDEGHKIVCASIAISENEVYVFMMPTDPNEQLPFVRILKDKNIKKLGQNIKFEDTWSKIYLNTTIRGWEFDAMLASHVLDNRQSITGLKFQTFVQLGIADYDSEIAPYLKSDDPDNSNAFNKIMECVKNKELRQKLLKYCAYDSINEYRIINIQRNLMDDADLPF